MWLGKTAVPRREAARGLAGDVSSWDHSPAFSCPNPQAGVDESRSKRKVDVTYLFLTQTGIYNVLSREHGC